MPENSIVYANLITFCRVFLVLLSVWLLSGQTSGQGMAALMLIILVFYLDVLDGQVARVFDQESDIGGILDTIADRVVENVLWLWFSYQGLVPLFVPAVVLVRCLLTDTINALILTRGRATSTLDASEKLDWLASSRFMRGMYGTFKLFTFAGLTLLAVGNQARGSGAEVYGLLVEGEVVSAVNMLIAVTVSFCLLRALPIIWKGLRCVSEWAEWQERKDMLN